LIDALAEVEGEELHLDDLPPADYLTRLIRTLADQKLPPEKIEEARVWGETRKRERMKRAEQRNQEAETAAS